MSDNGYRPTNAGPLVPPVNIIGWNDGFRKLIGSVVVVVWIVVVVVVIVVVVVLAAAAVAAIVVVATGADEDAGSDVDRIRPTTDTSIGSAGLDGAEAAVGTGLLAIGISIGFVAADEEIGSTGGSTAILTDRRFASALAPTLPVPAVFVGVLVLAAADNRSIRSASCFRRRSHNSVLLRARTSKPNAETICRISVIEYSWHFCMFNAPVFDIISDGRLFFGLKNAVLFVDIDVMLGLSFVRRSTASDATFVDAVEIVCKKSLWRGYIKPPVSFVRMERFFSMLSLT
jgi:hypothetical protein